MNTPSDNFDFDSWMNLAKDDPAAFEQRRREAIDAFMAQVPANKRTRLERLQWRVDMEVKRSKSPTLACMRVFNMMWDSVYGDRGLLNALTDFGQPGEIAANRAMISPRSRSTATMLPFRRTVDQNTG